MTDLKLNETPIRTARNYRINNIKLKEINIPKKLEEFKGLTYIGNRKNVSITENNIEKIDFKYGNGDILQKQVPNKILKIEHNGNIKVIAKKNSKLNIIIVNLLNNKTNNFISIENELKENADVKYITAEFGGKNTVVNYYTNLKEENANNEIKTIYLGSKEQVIDLNYIVEAYGKKTNVDIDVKGAIKDKCKKHFKGTIDFKKGCKTSKGNENEYCTILSETAKSIALPMLLCSEDDVEGNHSTASGKVDNKILFYVMSRGLSYKEAVKLLVKSNFTTIIDRISDENLKEEVIRRIDEKLD